MDFPYCHSRRTPQLQCTTDLGYAIFRYKNCQRTVNERTVGSPPYPRSIKELAAKDSGFEALVLIIFFFHVFTYSLTHRFLTLVFKDTITGLWAMSQSFFACLLIYASNN